jgi:HEPN domain-containing protein/predicted nucleotidyltransferase
MEKSNRTTGKSDFDLLIEHIVEQVAPEQIILFGSRARGDYHEHSDYDLLMIMEKQQDFLEMLGNLYETIRVAGLMSNIDLLAITRDDYESLKYNKGYIYIKIARDGKIVYDSLRKRIKFRNIIPFFLKNIKNLSNKLYSGNSVTLEEKDMSPSFWLEHAEAFLIITNNDKVKEMDCNTSWGFLCYHSHQVIESSLKGLLCLVGIEPDHKHSLVELSEVLANTIEIPCYFLTNIQIISPYGLTGNYPGPGDIFTKETYQHAFKIATDFYEWARTEFTKH